MTAAFLRWLLPAFAVALTLPCASAQEASPAPGTTAAPPSAAAGTAVHPEAKYVWSDCHVNGQYIAMTFDDGPSAKLTPQLLKILKDRNMHVTFFVLGEMVKQHPEIVKQAIADGHEVGNHSYDHPQLSKLSDEAVRSQLDRTKELITAATGQPLLYMRPPYGALTKEQKKWIHGDLGYQIILWDVDPLDWKRPGPAVVEDRILQGVRPGSIILSHDIHPGTVEAMPDTFDKLLAKGFKFVTVSELLALNQPLPEKHPGAKTAEATEGTPHPRATPRPPSANLPDKITGAPNQ